MLHVLVEAVCALTEFSGKKSVTILANMAVTRSVTGNLPMTTSAGCLVTCLLYSVLYSQTSKRSYTHHSSSAFVSNFVRFGATFASKLLDCTRRSLESIEESDSLLYVSKSRLM
jgi:hypothetical protein